MNDMEDGVVTNLVSFLNKPKDYGEMGLQAFFGFMIGFSFLALLGGLLTACCNKYGCRHLMYFACIFLMLAGFIAFLFSVMLSIFVPIFTWTCSYIDVTISTSSGFTSTIYYIQPTWEYF